MPIEAKLRITATGLQSVQTAFRQTSRSVQAMGDAGVAATRRLASGASAVKSKIQGLYGMLGGVGLVAGAKRVMDYRNALGQLQADIGLTDDKARGMDQRVRQVSEDFKMQKESILAALQVYQDFGGIVPKGMQTLDRLTKVSKATGTEMDALATIHSTFIQTLKMTPEEGIEAITRLTSQSIAGQVALRNLANVLPEVLAGGTAYGFKGQRGVEQLGMALQVAGQATGGRAEESRTMVKALLRDLTAQEKKLGKMGIKVFDKEGMRDLDAIMRDIIIKTKGRMEGKGGLASIFTADSQTMAAAFAASFDLARKQFTEGGTVTSVKAAGQQANWQTVEEMYRRRTEGIAKEAQAVEGALAHLDSALMEYGGKVLEWAAADPSKALMAAGGAYAGLKIAPKLFGSLFNILRGGMRGRGGAGGSLLGGIAGGATPVLVVNLEKGGLGSAVNNLGSAGGAAQQTASGLGKLGTAAEVLKGSFAALSIGVGIGTAVDELTGASDQISDWLFSLMNPGERERRIAVSAAAKDEERKKQETTTYQLGKKQDVFTELQEKAAQYARMGGARSGSRGEKVREVAEKTLTRAATEAGFSQSEISMIMPVLIRIARGVEKEATFNISPTGLDKIEVQKGRGPRQ